MNTDLATLPGEVAIVGAGAMGGAMARRLRQFGTPVRVRDQDAACEQRARDAGCSVWPSAAAAAEGVRWLIVAVTDAAESEDVLFGEDGAAAALGAGAVVLLCPTLGPETVRDLGDRLLARGLQVLDAPMSGGPARAESGTMSLMLAGAADTQATAEPLLARLSNQRFDLGPRLGDAARTKLVNNLLAAANLAAAAEALQLASRLGLDVARTVEVIAASSGASWIALDRARRAAAGDATVHARTALLAKDSALAAVAARPHGGLGPLGTAACERFAQALAAGLTEADDSAVLSLPVVFRAPEGGP